MARKVINDPPPRVRRGNHGDAQKMRAAALDAAMVLFSQGGLQAVTMRAVAARLRVSPMTPYRYFEGKADLLRGLWQFVLRSVCDQMTAAIQAQSDPRARLRASLVALLAYYECHPDHYRLLYMTEQTTQRQSAAGLTSAPVYNELLDIVHAAVAQFARHIGAGLEHLKLATDVRAAMQLGYLHGTMINVRYPWMDREQLREVYVDRIIDAMEHCLRYGPGPAQEQRAAA